MLMNLTASLTNILKPLGLGKKFVDLILGGEEFFKTDRVYNPFLDRVVKRLILEIPGRGCAWFKESGGCTMCGFNQKLETINKRWNFSASDLIAFYKIAESLNRDENPELLCIFNGGSFLNEEEVPLETQLAIAKAVHSHPKLRLLFVESRPEFVTNDRISQLLNFLQQKKLEIGIGLEAVTDKVREEYIHKGFNLTDYEKAVGVVKTHGAYLFTYVFLKPFHFSEKEAIEEAVRTIEYVFEKGADEVSLSCAFVQEGTQMAAAYKKGEFRPPWLWSIIEVVYRTAHLGPVRIGSFKDNPPPIDIPHNCPKCSQKVERALQEYNLSRDISIFDQLFCECKNQWKKETLKA